MIGEPAELIGDATDLTDPTGLIVAGTPHHQPEPHLDRKTRAARVLSILDRLMPAPAIPLHHADPFQLLVAVILSAQCTDARVNLITPALFARAPDAASMAKLRAPQIRTYIKSCGLAPSKAKAIRKTSIALVEKFAGVVPRDLAALEELPGVGHKTASVVLAQAFGEPAFPVDTHIHRLAGRWQLSRARTVEEVEHDLTQLFPREIWNTLHLQFIYFGRAYCTAKQHVPAVCPICSWAMSKARAKNELRLGSKLLATKKRKKKPAETPGKPSNKPKANAASRPRKR